MGISTNISPKLSAILLRFVRFFRLFLPRLSRLFHHLYRGLTFQMSRKEYWKDEAPKSSRGSVILLWIGELFILILEILGVGEFYETLMDLGKSKSRLMQSWEIKMAQKIYGNSIDYQQIRIDETAYLGPKQYHFCYVSFNLINSWKRMQNHILIHELMHVWQYQKMGAIYMLRALSAQHTEMGYNYGGVIAIKEKMANGETLLDFNLEQQADVVADYFLLKNEYAPQWGSACIEDLGVYEEFLEILGKDRFIA